MIPCLTDEDAKEDEVIQAGAHDQVRSLNICIIVFPDPVVKPLLRSFQSPCPGIKFIFGSLAARGHFPSSMPQLISFFLGERA